MHTVGSKRVKNFVFVIATVITIAMKILQENYYLNYYVFVIMKTSRFVITKILHM